MPSRLTEPPPRQLRPLGVTLGLGVIRDSRCQRWKRMLLGRLLLLLLLLLTPQHAIFGRFCSNYGGAFGWYWICVLLLLAAIGCRCAYHVLEALENATDRGTWLTVCGKMPGISRFGGRTHCRGKLRIQDADIGLHLCGCAFDLLDVSRFV